MVVRKGYKPLLEVKPTKQQLKQAFKRKETYKKREVREASKRFRKRYGLITRK